MRKYFPHGDRNDYGDTPEDLQILYRRLQAGGQRKKNGLAELDSATARNRIILYGLAGSAFLAGLFFVLF